MNTQIINAGKYMTSNAANNLHVFDIESALDDAVMLKIVENRYPTFVTTPADSDAHIDMLTFTCAVFPAAEGAGMSGYAFIDSESHAELNLARGKYLKPLVVAPEKLEDNKYYISLNYA